MPDYSYDGLVDRVIDGDTVDVVMDLGMRVYFRCRLRVAHLDAPEMSTDAGKAAKAHAQTLLPEKTRILIRTQKPDKYGRALADIAYRTPSGFEDFATSMRDAGHGVPYEGGAR